MKQKILYIFTRTPLHVGAGSSVGAIDQPVQRERHTGFPIIPASSLKGSFADYWNDTLIEEQIDRKLTRKRVNDDGKSSTAAWLFGSDNDKHPGAGALLFTEARVIAFPIRSAKGSFAWITCPLMLQRAARDGALSADLTKTLTEPADTSAIFKKDGPLALQNDKIVLEEYCFTRIDAFHDDLAKEIAGVCSDSALETLSDRLVILSNGMMTHFATSSCDVAQHVRISDETGTAEGTGLFNQENVPTETLFYSVVTAVGRINGDDRQHKSGDEALDAFAKTAEAICVFQFGGDASTGHGFCSVELKPRYEAKQ